MHDRSSVKFNLIDPETGNGIRPMSPSTRRPRRKFERRNLVKGYEFKKRDLLLTDEDFDSVKVDSSEVITVEKFVIPTSIDPIYYNSGYYLAPDGSAGRDVYQILREAIGRTRRVALSRVVNGQRERVVAIRLFGNGLAAHTLHEQRDLNRSTACLTNRLRPMKRWSNWPLSWWIARPPRMIHPTSRIAMRPGFGQCWTPN